MNGRKRGIDGAVVGDGGSGEGGEGGWRWRWRWGEGDWSEVRLDGVILELSESPRGPCDKHGHKRRGNGHQDSKSPALRFRDCFCCFFVVLCLVTKSDL